MNDFEKARIVVRKVFLGILGLYVLKIIYRRTSGGNGASERDPRAYAQYERP